jgi:hypothetical protein
LSVIGTLDKPDCGPGEKKSAYQRNKSNIVASGGTFWRKNSILSGEGHVDGKIH